MALSNFFPSILIFFFFFCRRWAFLFLEGNFFPYLFLRALTLVISRLLCLEMRALFPSAEPIFLGMLYFRNDKSSIYFGLAWDRCDVVAVMEGRHEARAPIRVPGNRSLPFLGTDDAASTPQCFCLLSRIRETTRVKCTCLTEMLNENWTHLSASQVCNTRGRYKPPRESTGAAEGQRGPIQPLSYFLWAICNWTQSGKQNRASLESCTILYILSELDFISNFRDLFLLTKSMGKFPCDFIQTPEGSNQIKYQSKLKLCDHGSI